MKNLLIIVLIIIIGITGFNFLNKNSKILSTSPIISSTPMMDNQNKSPSNSFTTQEVAKHNNPKDCWIIINNKIYNVTDYIKSHPGGDSGMIGLCGKDATNGYQTKGDKRPHSKDADALLSQLFIGDLK